MDMAIGKFSLEDVERSARAGSKYGDPIIPITNT